MVQEVEKREGVGEEREEKWRQYVSSLSILCVAVLVGLPLWWKTTEVYRCPLPYSEIQSLALQQVPPVLLYTVSVLVLHDGESESTLVARLQQELGNQTVRSGAMATTVSFLVRPLDLEPKVRERVREAVYSDVSLTHTLPPMPPGHYSVVVAPGTESLAKSGVVLSSSRWALIHTGTGGAESAVLDVVGVVKWMVVDDEVVRGAVESVAGREEGRSDKEDMRQIRSAQGYQVSVTLLVPDPSETAVDWNIETATDRVLLPFLHHSGMSGIANFSISSQVFHYTDVKFSPRRDSSGRHHVPSASLPPMISSVESKLGSLVSQLPSLNFLVLVPRRTHSPLFIKDPQGQFTDNFLVPQWGGVVFYSPPEWGVHGGEEEGEVVVEMERVMAVFVRQLQLLLGVPPLPDTGSRPEVVLEPGNLGITEWQIDQLLVARMLESISTATTSLISLVELLDKVKNMVISDAIQQEVVSSLASLQECYRLAGRGDLKMAYSYAKKAMISAETAFFDPSILELLYFPDDQKFAIYIPLFLPISIPIGMSTVATVRWVTSTLRTKHT